MLFVVLFEDEPRFEDMRRKHMDAHLEFLSHHADRIHAAGPLRDTEGDAPAGGLWIVQADSAQPVRELIEADPFWPTGLRKSVCVLAWTQVFADGRTLV